MEKAQEEYYLNEKMKAIQQELGRKDERVNEIEDFRLKIESANMPEEAQEKALQELKRLEVMPPVSAEATVSRNYLEWLLAVPWSKKSRELRDIKRAEKILEEVIAEEVGDYMLTVTAMIHLCDLLISELKDTGAEELFGEIKELTNRLLEISKKQS